MHRENKLARAARLAVFVSGPDKLWRLRILVGYSRWLFLGRGGRAAPNPARIAGMTIAYGDAFMFRITFREIFIGRGYATPNENDSDVHTIVDAGANIGLASLFFAHEHPRAQIHCFEPSEVAFRLLKTNVERNGVSATLHPYAVGAEDGELEFFYLDGAAGDIGHSSSRDLRDVFEDPERLRSHKVEVRSLEPLLEQGVDLLKVDIEGGEGALLPGIQDHLARVKYLVMEFHHIPGTSLLGDALNVLEAAGHHYQLQGFIDNSAGAVCEIRSKATGEANVGGGLSRDHVASRLRIGG